jgi:hypothetical protein
MAARKKSRTKQKGATVAAAKRVSLRRAHDELKRVQSILGAARPHVDPDRKKILDLKIKALKGLIDELKKICAGFKPGHL